MSRRCLASSVRRFAALGVVIGVLSVPATARAYRPFDGTDAAVADEGEFEAETGMRYAATHGGSGLAVPATVLNLGILPNVEAVLDFEPLLFQTAGEAPRFALVGTDVFAKWVFRRGSLQGASGPSLALEAGPLLPEFNGDARFGAQASLIGSERSRELMGHLNVLGALSRLGNPGVLGSLILEGLPESRVRPVTELLVEAVRHEQTTYSALEGFIWTARDWLVFDSALRVGRIDRHELFELRAGVTWALEVWSARH
jgi:hypothetical protein